MTATGRTPKPPGIRARPVLWLLLLLALLGAIPLLPLSWIAARGGGARPPATAPSTSASAHRWHPRSGKDPVKAAAASGERAPSTARGRVVAADGGAPIAGASVTMYRGQESFAELVTDARGAFEEPVTAAQIDLEITAPGFVTAYETMLLPREPITIALVRGAVLRGLVVRDDTGEPVAGARVDPGSIAGEIDDAWIAQTDDAGRFRIEGLTAGEYKPTAEARGLFAQATSRVTLSPGEVSPPVTIRVRSAATVRGRLELSATHRGCAPGTVTITSRVHGEREAASDPDGNVVFDAVPAGTWDVKLSCEGHVDEEEAPPLTVQSTDIEVVFALHEKLTVTGVVVTPDGAPAPEAWIEVAMVDGPEDAVTSHGTRSGEDGRFTLRDLAAGTYDLAASGAIDAPKVRVAVAEGAPPPEVRLVRDLLSFHGRVVDPEGDPVGGAGVTVTRDPTGNGSFGTQTGEDGRFVVEHFGAGPVTLKVQVGSREVPLQGGAGVIILPVAQEVTLVAQVPEGAIEGVVSGSTGPRAEVQVVGSCGEEGGQSAVTDGAGHFVLLRLRPGADCSLRAVARGGESAVAEAVHVGGRVDLALRAAAKLKGTAAGAGASFVVSVDGEGFSREEVFHGTDGAWDVPGLPAGACVVRISTDTARGSAKLTLAPGEERSVAITLRPGTGDGADEDPE